jgi:hypothetical protein
VLTLSVFLIIIVLLLLFTSGRATSEKDVSKVALEYAKSQCKSREKNVDFCNNLYIELGEKQEDFAEVFWIASIYKGGTREAYSGLAVVSNNGNPKVKENSYVLTHS